MLEPILITLACDLGTLGFMVILGLILKKLWPDLCLTNDD